MTCVLCAAPDATLTTLPPMPEGSTPDRLGLARWITMTGNPLTARVAATTAGPAVSISFVIAAIACWRRSFFSRSVAAADPGTESSARVAGTEVPRLFTSVALTGAGTATFTASAP